MKLSLRQNAEIERMKSEIAYQYGVKDFEDIDRSLFSSGTKGKYKNTGRKD